MKVDNTRPREAGSDRPLAIVIGIDSLQGLQTARILTSRGIRVIGIAKNPSHYAAGTRVCDEILVADTGGRGVIDLLVDIGPGFATKPVLFPCQDKNVLVVSRHRAVIEAWYEVALPSPEIVEMMMDKSRFYEWATANGFPLTPTFVLRSRADAERAAAKIAYPSILKPSMRLREWSRHTREKAAIVDSAAEFLDGYDRFSDWADVLIVQELIQGPETNQFTFNGYFGRSGDVLATVTTRKVRQWPVGTGQATLSYEVDNDTVAREALRLFESVDYRGLAYLEMKVDDRTGKYYIVEPNIGRPTGRSATAEAVGIELLQTMYCDAAGLPVPEDCGTRRRGVKWIHLVRDTQAALHHVRRRDLGVLEWLRSLRGPKVYAVLSLRDPVPFLRAIRAAVFPGWTERRSKSIDLRDRPIMLPQEGNGRPRHDPRRDAHQVEGRGEDRPVHAAQQGSLGRNHERPDPVDGPEPVGDTG